MEVFLERAYLPDDSATIGKITIGDWSSFTIERPWRNNEPYVSCIPEGNYKLRKRTSPVVQRSSGHEFQEGWEVVDVPGRTFIMIHPANWARELAGCIAPGSRLGWTLNDGFMVKNSRVAFRELMKKLDQEDEHTLIITTKRAAFYAHD